MSTLMIHREGLSIGWYSFGTLSQVSEQEQPPGGNFGGLPIRAVRLGALLAPLELREEYLTFHSLDGFSASLPWSRVNECLVAYRLGVLPLPRRFGGPYRLLMESNPRFCLKYLDVVELSAEPGVNLLPTCSHLAAAAGL